MYNNYRNGFQSWGFGKYFEYDFNDVDRAGAGRCGSCMDGKVGRGMSTYHNNRLLGSCERPVLFTDIKKVCIDGKEVDVLVADREFFDRLRFDCTLCREFFASICTCIEFGDVRPVFISDDDCRRLLPLETSRNGFMIHADQIQPFADSMRLVKMTACFDPCNEHVTISNYYKRHVKCDCMEDRKHDCCDCHDTIEEVRI